MLVIVLIINAIAVLSEDRFLARSTLLPFLACAIPHCQSPLSGDISNASGIIVGWGRTQAEPGFGANYDSTSVKAKSVNLIASVRTVMRSTCTFPILYSRCLLQCPMSIFDLRALCALLAQRTGQAAMSWTRTLSANAQLAKLVPLIIINTIIIVYELILG